MFRAGGHLLKLYRQANTASKLQWDSTSLEEATKHLFPPYTLSTLHLDLARYTPLPFIHINTHTHTHTNIARTGVYMDILPAHTTQGFFFFCFFFFLKAEPATQRIRAPRQGEGTCKHHPHPGPNFQLQYPLLCHSFFGYALFGQRKFGIYRLPGGRKSSPEGRSPPHTPFCPQKKGGFGGGGV